MAHTTGLEGRIREIASGLYSSMQEETPSLFNKRGWQGRVLGLAMRDDSFKIQLLRFVDALPALKTDTLVLRLFREY
ncbi:MAG TPA: hypothetical protein VF790_03010, partial [Dissulfurispiraceae bacterium]